MNNKLQNKNGFTLIELVLVIVIIGIMASVALKSGGELYETAKIEETKQELDALAVAIAGNPELNNNGVRSDFGYVGDVGAMPADLDALYANPGGYSTWRGPYIDNRFTQVAADYKTDGFGASYVYAGAATITSTGANTNIVRRLANSTDDLLYNNVSGNIFDYDGSPPGSIYADSITIQMTVPNGSGAMATRTGSADRGGYFKFDSVPIGNHALQIVYRPTSDTLFRLVSVSPHSASHSEYRLRSNVWYSSAGGGLTLVTGSDSLITDCHGLYFYILNSTGGPIDISSISLDYALTGYYRQVKWDGATVFDEVNPAAGSGDLASFTSTQTIADGAAVRIDIDVFKSTPTGGPNISVNGTTFTVTFSDGSSFDITTGACP
jgi:prepilin-type N-terminal cleavage/methylation domain-containing protein